MVHVVRLEFVWVCCLKIYELNSHDSCGVLSVHTVDLISYEMHDIHLIACLRIYSNFVWNSYCVAWYTFECLPVDTMLISYDFIICRLKILEGQFGTAELISYDFIIWCLKILEGQFGIALFNGPMSML